MWFLHGRIRCLQATLLHQTYRGRDSKQRIDLCDVPLNLIQMNTHATPAPIHILHDCEKTLYLGLHSVPVLLCRVVSDVDTTENIQHADERAGSGARSAGCWSRLDGVFPVEYQR
ncbi:hypothetical protein FKM82_026716 [Ascaphus truei]